MPYQEIHIIADNIVTVIDKRGAYRQTNVLLISLLNSIYLKKYFFTLMRQYPYSHKTYLI